MNIKTKRGGMWKIESCLQEKSILAIKEKSNFERTFLNSFFKKDHASAC